MKCKELEQAKTEAQEAQPPKEDSSQVKKLQEEI